MTEEGWQRGDEPLSMLESVYGRGMLNRKRRLFLCGCCRVLWASESVTHADVISIAESCADDLDAPKARREANRAMAAADWSESGSLFRLLHAATLHDSSHAKTYNAILGLTAESPHLAQRASELIRDIFGNPFRPVAFLPEWRTSTAVALATAMYESRDFGPMPVLADSLEEAGCDHPDVLAHCRDANGVHVRGCWVIDLVLGKT
jgi:hypothetical protein